MSTPCLFFLQENPSSEVMKSSFAFPLPKMFVDATVFVLTPENCSFERKY